MKSTIFSIRNIFSVKKFTQRTKWNVGFPDTWYSFEMPFVDKLYHFLENPRVKNLQKFVLIIAADSLHEPFSTKIWTSRA